MDAEVDQVASTGRWDDSGEAMLGSCALDSHEPRLWVNTRGADLGPAHGLESSSSKTQPETGCPAELICNRRKGDPSADMSQ